jgi:hypothetical protein
MNRRGVEFSLMQARPGLWSWRFQIGETVTNGKTEAKLMGLAVRRVQQRIDRELNRSKARNLTAGRSANPVGPPPSRSGQGPVP